MGVKPGSTGGFYREEAAQLAAAAARARPKPVRVVRPAYVPLVLAGEPSRPLLTPNTPNNQNGEVDPRRRPGTDAARAPALGRLLARVVLMPLYLLVGAASLGLIALFVKDLFGL